MTDIFTGWPLAGSAAALLSFLLAVLLVLSKRWHGRFSMDNSACVQKFHTEPTPRIGGAAIACGVILGYALAPPGVARLLGPLLLASIPALAMGLLEDVTRRVGVRARLLATMACSVLGWAITGLAITDVNVPGLDWLLGFTLLSVAFTALAVGGVANAFNIIDGFHGLAAGTALIVLGGLGLMAWRLGDPELVGLSLILGGAVLGFGLVNWPFGKLFLGDGGAYFVGFGIAWLTVLLLARHPQVSAWAPLLACGYPVLEVGFSMLRRSRRKSGMGRADRLHLHSLVKRRLVRANLPGASNLVCNSSTGAVMWFAALLPVVLAVTWPTSTATLALCWLACAFLYSAFYARLTQFRWCFSAATLQPRPAKA
jgi:UDP-N-acetylmuramyl pentapeptide phosphotransferase/UDP-N-acetylglucosamine-1-phosphate transferase